MSNHRTLWLAQLESLEVEYAPVLPSDGPISSLPTSTLREIVLRAVSEYEKWATHDNIPVSQEVIAHPAPCFARDDLRWSHGCPILTADGNYALYSTNLRLKTGGGWLGRYIQCLHIPSDTAIWQYPPPEKLRRNQKIWIEQYSIQSNISPDSSEDRLYVSVLGTDPSTKHRHRLVGLHMLSFHAEIPLSNLGS